MHIGRLCLRPAILVASAILLMFPGAGCRRETGSVNHGEAESAQDALTSSGQDDSNPVVYRPFSKQSGDTGEKLFRRLGPDETGIDFTIEWDKPAKYDRIFYSQNTGGGVTIGDYDGDGMPDVNLTRPSNGNRLYRNLGNLKFQDVTESAGLADADFWSGGASFVDVDNDGDLDLYACGYACANRLLR